MNFLGYPANNGPLFQDLDANGHSIDNLSTLTMLEVPAAPPVPFPPDSAKYYTDATGTLNSIDHNGAIRTYVSAAGGIEDRIISPDSSSEVQCINGGTILFTGLLNLQNNNIENVEMITASTAVPFALVKANVDLGIDTDLFVVTMASIARIYADASASVIFSPDNNTDVGVANGTVALAVNGGANTLIMDSLTTTLSIGTTFVLYDGVYFQSSIPFFSISRQDPINPEITWNDATNTGIYSPTTGSIGITTNGVPNAIFNGDVNGTVLLTNGAPSQFGSKLEVATFQSGNCEHDLHAVGGQAAHVMTFANGTWGARTRTLNGNSLGILTARGWSDAGIYNDRAAAISFQATQDFTTATTNGTKIAFFACPNGSNVLQNSVNINSVGLGCGTNATAMLDAFGPLLTTFRMRDTSQGTGKVMLSDASGFASWYPPDAVFTSKATIYYEGAPPTGTAFAFGVTNMQYIINPVTTIAFNNNFSMPSNGRLMYTGTQGRVFAITAEVSYYTLDLLTPVQNYFYIFKNGGQWPGGRKAAFSTNLLNLFTPVSFTTSIPMFSGDYLEIYASNNTSGAGIQVIDFRMTIN